MLPTMLYSQGIIVSVILSLAWTVRTHAVHLSLTDPGCADRTREGLHSLKRVAACAGEWRGHIVNADHLCARGWHVCSHKDRRLLKEITWKDATEFGGCYAFNAAQDGGKCHECQDHLEKDDLAAVGRGCPHQNYGQTSCITGGKIDASCCVDTHFNKSCIFQPGLMSGVLCCNVGDLTDVPVMPVTTTVVPITKPVTKLKVSHGVPVFVTCQTSGSVSPDVKWYKDGHMLPGSSPRISVLTSGDLFIVPSKTSDSGMYTCVYTSTKGEFIAVETLLSVEQKYPVLTGPDSGCAVGVQERLVHLKGVRACYGMWLGHVRKARKLCAKGWHVCSPKDSLTLHNITWDEVMNTEGCYAYNAANMPNKCSRCRGEFMAGVGRDCEVVKKSLPSCLLAGYLNVFQKRKSGCHYTPGVTSGVLCCRKRTIQNNRGQKWIYPQCKSGCTNGGRCIATNKCLCPEGYSGPQCQQPVCQPSCSKHGMCVKPGVCKCHKGYVGRACTIRLRHYRCRVPCYNGGKCHKGKCICSKLYWGMSCHHVRWFAMAHWNSTED